jgi:type IV pilus assembly protein PilM
MFFQGKSNQTLGLDIGTHSIKAVLVETHHRRPRLLKAGMKLIQGEAPYEPKKLRKAETLLALRELMAELKINPAKVKNLVTCLGGPATSMKEISSVRMSEDELSSSLIFEARKHLPLDDSDTVIDYQSLGEDPEDPQKMRILLVATTRKMYGWHESILKEAGFRPGVVDLDPLAVVNSYTIQEPFPDEGQILFLNVGARGTHFTVAGMKGKIFNRDIPIGGFHLSDDLARRSGISFDDADARKCERGVEVFHEGESQDGLALQQRTALEDFLDEIRRTIRFYVKESGESKFAKVYLAGGGACLQGLDLLLTEKFKMPVEVWNPIAGLDGAEVLDPALAPQFAQCIGLARRSD